MATDERRYAAATERNREPILAVLREALPARGLVLEIASGSGEHVVHFARVWPELRFQPSDPDAAARRSIDAWTAHADLDNVLPALALDAAAPDWPIAQADALICINMVHISPWAATQGLMRGAGRLLAAGAPLYLYGPYRQNGVPLAPSNAAFDESLRLRDPAWGLRDVEAVAALAAEHGFGPPAITAMPANNLSLIFRKRPG